MPVVLPLASAHRARERNHKTNVHIFVIFESANLGRSVKCCQIG
jgi:hypothetical protein